MNRNYILALITVLILNSCGKSEKEIKIEKEKIEFLKIHEQRVSVGKRKKITELTMQLQRLPDLYKKAKKEIEKIKMFKIGRSKSTKKRQLREAYNGLSELYDYEKQLKNEIAQSEYLKTFEFQKKPKNVIEYIFESAKEENFEDFRNLCDPYGENNRNVNKICLAEILQKKEKQQLIDMFKNGRIIGDIKISGNSAIIEFAYGLNSNKLEKMSLVKRNNLWYLSSL
ncbi:hypothetical protein J2Q11_11055 [Tenacibaculum finnmarkense genomovar finnmarkense]|uniref:hypothetical protein n=3 Tax=Flavobacteriaceae TaxID=49546 RepID=UPI00187B1297|nr:hypothetical protein [Tenacibaculum finnmarkense]MCD8405868.1 hypothetical protein [Tenacibaculum dicentrarchi]MBE7661414.1 hypothetical protein [Tenacibaculum finnmarkense genomovar finnmarkense]MCD8408467.1 hypothetical protein [Tenacibaculum dicentrarchi]MCD8415753.1 hypothetical protein [Tenacibaculum dicentrarchi]MCD8418271.1 hypothetical protein [Tenacibaculum finnmarkense genomovar finnmarkense]